MTADEKISSANANVESRSSDSSSSWSEPTAVSINLVATIGFVVGSAFWFVDYATVGADVFGVSCILSGIGQSMYGYKFFMENDLVGVYAIIQLVFGCIAFCVGAFLFPFEFSTTFCLLAFLVGSVSFLTGCLLIQFQQQSWLGILAPLFQNTPKLIPTGLLNTVGSALFTVGSIFLFFDWGGVASTWLYLVGSILFAIAAWGDWVIWYLADQKANALNEGRSPMLHKVIQNTAALGVV